MRNLLLALTTGILAGQFWSFYRELKLKRIEERDQMIDEALPNHPHTASKIKTALYK